MAGRRLGWGCARSIVCFGVVWDLCVVEAYRRCGVSARVGSGGVSRCGAVLLGLVLCLLCIMGSVSGVCLFCLRLFYMGLWGGGVCGLH